MYVSSEMGIRRAPGKVTLSYCPSKSLPATGHQVILSHLSYGINELLSV